MKIKIKILLLTLMVMLLSCNCVLAASTLPSEGDVLKANVSVEIHPIYTNLSEQQTVMLVNLIGKRLVEANKINKDIKFYVIDKKDVNAYADVKNTVNIYTGILKYVESEDELAAIIGHEIGHVSHSHVKKSIAKGAVISTAIATGASRVLKAATRTSGLVMLGAGTAATVANQAWTRKYESVADMSGIDYMVKAGYNPLASISIMNKISDDYFDFLSDHPSGDKRIYKEYQYIEKNYPKYLEHDYPTDSYAAAMDEISVKFISKKNKKNTKSKTKNIEENI